MNDRIFINFSKLNFINKNWIVKSAEQQIKELESRIEHICKKLQSSHYKHWFVLGPEYIIMNAGNHLLNHEHRSQFKSTLIKLTSKYPQLIVLGTISSVKIYDGVNAENKAAEINQYYKKSSLFGVDSQFQKHYKQFSNNKGMRPLQVARTTLYGIAEGKVFFRHDKIAPFTETIDVTSYLDNQPIATDHLVFQPGNKKDNVPIVYMAEACLVAELCYEHIKGSVVQVPLLKQMDFDFHIIFGTGVEIKPEHVNAKSVLTLQHIADPLLIQFANDVKPRATIVEHSIKDNNENNLFVSSSVNSEAIVYLNKLVALRHEYPLDDTADEVRHGTEGLFLNALAKGMAPAQFAMDCSFIICLSDFCDTINLDTVNKLKNLNDDEVKDWMNRLEYLQRLDKLLFTLTHADIYNKNAIQDQPHLYTLKKKKDCNEAHQSFVTAFLEILATEDTHYPYYKFLFIQALGLIADNEGLSPLLIADSYIKLRKIAFTSSDDMVNFKKMTQLIKTAINTNDLAYNTTNSNTPTVGTGQERNNNTAVLSQCQESLFNVNLNTDNTNADKHIAKNNVDLGPKS